jgi:hypothetical protein
MYIFVIKMVPNIYFSHNFKGVVHRLVAKNII